MSTRKGPDYLEAMLRDAEDQIRSVNQFLFNTALLVLQEAFCCYRNGCTLASVAMCRGALAGMLHTLRVWIYDEYESKYRIARDERYRLGSLIKWAHDLGWLDDTQEKMAKEVQNMGNVSAHVVEKLNEDLAEIAKPTHVPMGLYVAKLRVNEQTSLELLKRTTLLLVQLAKALPTRRNHVPLPSWFKE